MTGPLRALAEVLWLSLAVAVGMAAWGASLAAAWVLAVEHGVLPGLLMACTASAIIWCALVAAAEGFADVR